MPRAVIASASEPDAGFGKGKRLHSRAEFSAVFASRKAYRATVFDAQYLVTSPAVPMRLGVIVPKRLAPTACQRNAIKRQAREAFRHATAGLKGMDVVIRLKRSLRGVAVADGRKHWRDEMNGLLRQLAAGA